MNKCALIFLLSLSANIHADEFYSLVTYECDIKKGELSIYYEGEFNEEGRLLVSQIHGNQWNPWDLINIENPDTKPYVKSFQTVKKVCELSDSEFHFTLKASPSNTNINGRCGMHMSAHVKIESWGNHTKTTIFNGVLDNACYDRNMPVITDIVIKSGSLAPIITTMPSNEFFMSF